jgi:hypothetical protein
MRKGVGMFSVVVVAMLVGCGSSGSGGTGGSGGSGGVSGGKGGAGGAGNTSGGGPITTSVPSGTLLTGLSGAQQTQLCNDLRPFTDTLAMAGCKVTALVFGSLGATTDAELQAACATLYASCLASDGGTTTCDPSATPSTCTATVGDLITCANAESAAAAQIPSCSSATLASVAALASDGGTSTGPAVCAQFNTGGSCNGGVVMSAASPAAP